MGGKPSIFTVYARDRKTDEYCLNPICSMVEHPNDMTLKDAMACFKREVYAYALQHKNYNTIKSIYLYENGWRVAKAIGEPHETRQLLQSVRMECRSPAYKHLWDASDEALAPKRWPLCERMFRGAFTMKEDDATSVTFVSNDHI